jgi:Secretion system C-terminal sorting domain
LKHQKFQARNHINIPGQGFNYYRVRVNTPTDSNLVSPVSFQYVEKQVNLRVYPNPVNNVLTLYFPEASSRFECIIVNANGSQVIKAISLHGKHNIINVEYLPKGRYSLILKHQNKRLIIPFMKG